MLCMSHSMAAVSSLENKVAQKELQMWQVL